MKRPRIVDLELEDLCEYYEDTSPKTLEYIEKLEKENNRLRLQLHGVACDVTPVNPPTNLAM